MIKASKQKIFISILILLIAITVCLNYVPKFSFAEENNTTSVLSEESLVVEANDRDKQPIDLSQLSTISYSGGIAYPLEWSKLKEFVIYYIPDETTPPPISYEQGKEELPENIIYTLNISIDYLKGYVDDGIFNIGGKTIHLENVRTFTQKGENGYKNFLTNKFTLNIDSGVSGMFQEQNVTISEWGIYRFTIDINGAKIVSDFYYVKPDTIIDEAPKINYQVVSSENSMHNAFICELTNANKYKYIDESSLVWYVKGEGQDGTKYALTADDLTKDSFIDCNASLYEYIDRTGTSFYFNDNNIAGKWQIWCEYKSYGSQDIQQSDIIIKVETGSSIDGMVLVYILIGLAITSIIVVFTIAIIRTKKDKVW